MVCPLSLPLVSYPLQFNNNLLFRTHSRFALTWFLLISFALTLFLQPFSFAPCQRICTLGVSPSFCDLLYQLFFCPMTYLVYEGYSVKYDTVN